MVTFVTKNPSNHSDYTRPNNTIIPISVTKPLLRITIKSEGLTGILTHVYLFTRLVSIQISEII